MKIDGKYGHPLLSDHVYAPVSDFPDDLYDRLVGALSGLAGLWSRMEVDAYRRDGVVHLRVTLDIGDRPLHLYLAEDSDMLLFDSPILFDFPSEASYFVLSQLCGKTTNLAFWVAEREVHTGVGDEDQKLLLQKTDVLYGWRWFNLETFVSSAHELMPIVVSELTEAEKELRVFLDGGALGESLVA